MSVTLRGARHRFLRLAYGVREDLDQVGFGEALSELLLGSKFHAITCGFRMAPLRQLTGNTVLMTASCQQVSIDAVRTFFVAASRGTGLWLRERMGSTPAPRC
jgi:hypothetical protein